MNTQNFRREEYHASWLEKFYRIANIKDRNRELFVSWYKDNYNSKFPFWIVVEMCNFNDISKFYNNLKPKVKKRMRGCFQHDYEYIESWLHTTVLIRKYLCADREIWNEFVKRMEKTFDKYEEWIELEQIGFPSDWRSLLK
ncbi:hypothetical protein HB850_05905 [Listeria newyorkensis]|uniref:Uncharacterized protein n=1 Tax=Listeria newyorkensis TaxID=1497681 RepID=A0A841YU51_9LIST|nr:hypothetical protein [Listeria newyorkensis]